MTSYQRWATYSLLLAVTGCITAGHQAPREYRGIVLDRVAELPATTDTPAAHGTAGFSRACAMRLRDPRDGRQMLLTRSSIRAPITSDAAVAVTRLESATGDYVLLTGDGRSRKTGPQLRVDCTTGRPLSWVAPGA